MFLKYAQIPHKATYLDMFKGENRTEDFKKINPYSYVPAMVDESNGLHLRESHAIMRYVCNTCLPEDNKFYPRNNFVAAAETDVYLDWHHTGTRLLRYYSIKVFMPKAGLGDRGDPAEDIPKVEMVLSYLEDHLKEQKFLSKLSTPGLADFAAIAEVTGLFGTPVELEKYPLVLKWSEEMFKIPEVKEVTKDMLVLIQKVGMAIPSFAA